MVAPFQKNIRKDVVDPARVEKIRNASYDDAIAIIYTWVKQGLIKKKEFTVLIWTLNERI